MDSDTKAGIDASRQRLRRFVETSTDEDLARPIEGDWTVSALLAHTAFWDRRAAWLVRHYLEDSFTPSPASLDEVNDSALPQWRLIPPRLAAQEALDAAADIDDLLAGLSAEQFAALRESRISFDRSTHRHEHLDQIEQVLG
jgi:hypothetical protein